MEANRKTIEIEQKIREYGSVEVYILIETLHSYLFKVGTCLPLVITNNTPETFFSSYDVKLNMSI